MIAILFKVPKIEGDVWHCNLFPNWPNYWVNMGSGANFCGRSKRRYPECDPQLPPTITFYGKNQYGQVYEMGKVDMKESINSGANAQTINNVLRNSPQGTMLVYIVHGFTNSVKTNTWIQDLRMATFNKYRQYRTVVAEVDWGWGANNHLVTSSKASLLLQRDDESDEDRIASTFKNFCAIFEAGGGYCQDMYADYGTGQKGPGITTLYRKAAANTVGNDKNS